MRNKIFNYTFVKQNYSFLSKKSKQIQIKTKMQWILKKLEISYRLERSKKL